MYLLAQLNKWSNSYTLLLLIILTVTHTNVLKIYSNTLATLVLWDQYVEQEGEIMRQLEGPFPVVQATRMRVSLYQGNLYMILPLEMVSYSYGTSGS